MKGWWYVDRVLVPFSLYFNTKFEGRTARKILVARKGKEMKGNKKQLTILLYIGRKEFIAKV